MANPEPVDHRLTPTASVLGTVFSVWWGIVGAIALIVGLVFCFQTPVEQGWWADHRAHFIGPLLFAFLVCAVGAAVRIVVARDAQWQRIVNDSESLRLEAVGRLEAVRTEVGTLTERIGTNSEDKRLAALEKQEERQDARSFALAERLSECSVVLNRYAAEGRRQAANRDAREQDLEEWSKNALDEVGAFLTHKAQARWAKVCRVEWGHGSSYLFGSIAQGLEEFRDTLSAEDVTRGS